ncbi:hypothetical protein [Saccharibacillus kuerlensis]|uniref:SH3 domain-containing protein n=1 Tax=Saccharibacillus kuerlensis TaxID=459527 RepID=A0ABQ2KT37_9BACL|nr:hypothetical protein [Saccharibacillus kuerlensis]GGN91424.1 hypothetical protein GCM10010969_03080 [Saccharibacillus kuerlensis]
MKRTLFKTGMLLALTAALFTAGCSKPDNEPFESITTSIRVTEKGQSDDLAEKWIIAANSNNNGLGDVRIEVENEMVWNLIEVNREYFVAYQGSKQKGYVLGQIEQVEE